MAKECREDSLICFVDNVAIDFCSLCNVWRTFILCMSLSLESSLVSRDAVHFPRESKEERKEKQKKGNILQVAVFYLMFEALDCYCYHLRLYCIIQREVSLLTPELQIDVISLMIESEILSYFFFAFYRTSSQIPVREMGLKLIWPSLSSAF